MPFKSPNSKISNTFTKSESELFELQKKLYTEWLNKTNQKFYADILYNDRVVAKQYGARFDGDKKKWYFSSEDKMLQCMNELGYIYEDSDEDS